MLRRLCDANEALLLGTAHMVVDVTDPASQEAGIQWWEELTSRGGEGMVVKPFEFIARGPRGLVQPAVKCRGPEYLRIIYGPEYTAPENLERLRQRGLSATRSLALRDFALGMEGLDGLFSASLCDLCMNVSSLEFRLNAGGRFNRSSNKLFLLLRTTLIDLNSKNFASLESACFNSHRLVITDSPDNPRQNLRSLRTLNPSMGVQQNGNEIYVAVHCCLPTN